MKGKRQSVATHTDCHWLLDRTVGPGQQVSESQSPLGLLLQFLWLLGYMMQGTGCPCWPPHYLIGGSRIQTWAPFHPGGSGQSSLVPTCHLSPFHIHLSFQLPASQLQVQHQTQKQQLYTDCMTHYTRSNFIIILWGLIIGASLVRQNQ